MTKGSDNDFPSVLLTEQGSAPTSPAASHQRLYIRTSDHTLVTVNSSGTVAPVSSGGTTVTVSEAFLTGDVTMTTNGTAYDGPSISLAAGTYLLYGRVIINLNSGPANAHAQLWDGTTTYDSAEQIYSAGGQVNLTVFGTVVLGGTTTVKVTCKAGANSSTIKATGGQYGITNKGSHIMAVKIA